LQSGQGGSPGTQGGAGAAGGSGGGGSGGAACAYFHGAAGTASANNTRFAVGLAGKGASGAPDGTSAFECQ
jgi:hypothetical protein